MRTKETWHAHKRDPVCAQKRPTNILAHLSFEARYLIPVEDAPPCMSFRRKNGKNGAPTCDTTSIGIPEKCRDTGKVHPTATSVNFTVALCVFSSQCDLLAFDFFDREYF